MFLCECTYEVGSGGKKWQSVYFQGSKIPLQWVVQQPLLVNTRGKSLPTDTDLWPETFCRSTNKIVSVTTHYTELCMRMCVTSCYWSYLGSRQSEDPSVQRFLKACSASSSLALSLRTGNLTGENEQPLATKTGLLMMLALFQPGKVSAVLRFQLML